MEKFGTVLGHAPGNVPVYSSDYETANDEELPNQQAYRSYLDGVFMGHKWQSVELARRWLYSRYGYVFDDVAMAYDIFRLRSVRVVGDGSRLPLRSFRNGSKRRPEPGSLLIWDEGGEFETTGHVAIVTEVTESHVRFAEQNFLNRRWPAGQDYSRHAAARITESGEYWIECPDRGSTILGWVVQTSDDTHAEPPVEIDARLLNPQARAIDPPADAERPWLDTANESEAAYVAMMGGHKLSHDPQNALKYLCISRVAHAELERATKELHVLFMLATDYVLRDDARLARFDIPQCLWPKIRQSWKGRRERMIAGQFDFSLSERGLKVYEYNCDSVSTHMENGRVQGKWAKRHGCDVGIDAGAQLHDRLSAAWTRIDAGGVLHILQADTAEDRCRASFMKEALQAAGIDIKTVSGVADLRWDRDGEILDGDGDPIRRVWKTQPWEVALDQIREECGNDEEKLARYRPGRRRRGRPRLVDVLLRNDVEVYEPLWTVIPSSKAILPVLSSIQPAHPYVLHSTYALTDELVAKGHASKPIVGQGGSNVGLYGPDEERLAEMPGEHGHRGQIFQALFELPVLDGYSVQVSTFSAGGKFAGAGARADRSRIIGHRSDKLALRIVDDDAFLRD